MCLESQSIQFDYEKEAPILGVRGFGSSGIKKRGWKGKEVGKAECNNNKQHDPAQAECTCGFYAYNTMEALEQYAQYHSPYAVVAGWGLVAVHANGWRAQYAKILAMSTPTTEDIEVVHTKDMDEWLDKYYWKMHTPVNVLVPA